MKYNLQKVVVLPRNFTDDFNFLFKQNRLRAQWRTVVGNVLGKKNRESEQSANT